MSGHERRGTPRRRVVDDWEPDESPRGGYSAARGSSQVPLLPWERDRLPQGRPAGNPGPARAGQDRKQEWNERFWEPEKRSERRRRRGQGRDGQGQSGRARNGEGRNRQAWNGETSTGQSSAAQGRTEQGRAGQGRAVQGRPAPQRIVRDRADREWEAPGRGAAGRAVVGRTARDRTARAARPASSSPIGRRDTKTMPAVGRGRPPLRVPGGRFADRVGVAGTVVTLTVGVAMLAVVERAVMDGTAVTQQSGARSQAAPPAPTARPTAGRPVAAPPPAADPVPVRPLADEVRSLTLAERGAQARRSYGTSASRPPLVGATRFSPDRTWAFGTTAIPVPAGRAAMPQVALFVARLTGGQWRLALAGTPEFTGLLRGAPTAMLPAGEKRLLARYGNAQAATGAGLMLPWKIGASWRMSAVARRTAEGTRPLGLVAFGGGDGRVLAAGPGRLYRFCSTAPGRGLVMIVHDNGLATLYYQMTQVTQVPDGTVVQRGAVLGKVGTDLPCGGEAAGPQVQFGLRKGADEIPLEGTTLGGWTFRERAVPLVGWAERGLLQVLPGGRLRNLGAVAPEAPVTPPSEEATPPSEIPQPSQT